MNPCAKTRKRIALMASDVLDVKESEALREHITNCRGCRIYWQSMSDLTGRLKNAGSLPAAEASESFHREVARKIAAQRHFSFSPWAIAVQRLLPGRRLAGFGVSVAVIVAVLVVFEPFRHRSHLPQGDRTGPASVSSRVEAPPSTLASYRRAAEISFESLDTFLTLQAARTSTATDTFTVSSPLHDSPDN